jgi:hypothetical protein
MIDPAELRAWLMTEMTDAPVDAAEEATRTMALGRVDAYLTVGRRFGLLDLDDDDVRAVIRWLP